MKDKIYPLKIETLRESEDDGTIVAYYSKGHHDFIDFAQAVKNEYEEDIRLEFIEHLWARCEMYGNLSKDFGHWFLTTYQQKEKGTFPVTYILIG